ncbi:unnamed protein product, partial [Symbiodinium sp. CCMP2456]
FHPLSLTVMVNGELCDRGSREDRLVVEELSLLRSRQEIVDKDGFLEKLKEATDGFRRQFLDALMVFWRELQHERLTRHAWRLAPNRHHHRFHAPAWDLVSPWDLVRWLQEDDVFLDEVLTFFAPFWDGMDPKHREVLLKAGEDQLRPIPGLAARLAKRSELKTSSWLEVLPCLRDNTSFLLNTLKHCTRQDAAVIAKHAAGEPLANEEFVKALVKKDGLLLRFASPTLRGKPDVVSLAMNENPCAFGHASEAIRADFKTAFFAVSQRGWLLEKVSGDLKANVEIVRTAVSQNVRAFESAGGDTKWLMQLAATEVLKSLGVEPEDLARALVANAQDVLKKCFEFGECPRLLKALQAYVQEAEKGKSDKPTNLSKKFALEIVRRSGYLYKQLPEAHKRDVDIAVEAVKKVSDLFPDHLPGNVRGDFEVMVTAVQSSGRRQLLRYRLCPSD